MLCHSAVAVPRFRSDLAVYSCCDNVMRKRSGTTLVLVSGLYQISVNMNTSMRPKALVCRCMGSVFSLLPPSRTMLLVANGLRNTVSV